MYYFMLKIFLIIVLAQILSQKITFSNFFYNLLKTKFLVLFDKKYFFDLLKDDTKITRRQVEKIKFRMGHFKSSPRDLSFNMLHMDSGRE